MVSALVYLLAVLVVAAVVYVLASLLFGRGEELEALPPGATPTHLPTGAIEASDVRSLRFQQVVRGYKASEVDWALERLARELEDVRGQVATLERQVELASGQRADEQGSTDD